jgi:hypothetical protein
MFIIITIIPREEIIVKTSTRQNVKMLVDEFPNLTKNRNELILNYWILFDGVNDLNDIPYVTPAESIAREFRNLVTQGSIVLNIEVQQALEEKRNEYYNTYTGGILR